MLTNNFLKMITTLGQSTTGIKIDGTEATMSFPVYTSGQKQRTYGYTQSESTYLFTKETATVSDLGLNNEEYAYSEQDINVYNAFFTYGGSSSTAYYSNTIAMLVGTGTTSPTKDDYKLEAQVELESRRDICYFNPSGKLVLARDFRNNTEGSVSINELGIYLVCGRYSNSTSNQLVSTFLIAREVLESPVTLAVGDSEFFTYTINMQNSIG